ncbi:MAG: LPXTG cell wall anchor domain-containing protein, partial [Candidatus Acidiferrales bacterium]
VWHTNPPKTVILTLPDGSNKQYTVPDGTKFMVEGHEATVFDLRKGMNVSATVITEYPEVEVRRDSRVAGQTPPPVVAEAPPETPQPVGPLLIEAPAPEPQPEREESPAQLPKTASNAPWLGLLGLGALGVWLLFRMLGRRTE